MFAGYFLNFSFKINVAKTEHLSTRENPLPMKVNGAEPKNVDHFKYLGSVIQ